MNPVYTILTVNDGTNTVRIDCTDVTRNITNDINFIPKPIKPSSQGSTSPTTITIDLKRVAYQFQAKGYLLDDTVESGDAPEAKATKMINMIDQKKGPFTLTYRGTSLGANWFLTAVVITDTNESEPTKTSNLVQKFQISINARRGSSR